MIAKTLIAVFGGCLVSISVMLNINFLLPVHIEIRLLVGLLLSFPIWIAAMIWAYSCSNILKVLKRYSGVLFISIAINSMFILG